jgi:hypothetical protein
MRAVRMGGPMEGFCNASKQKTCFYPTAFECVCTPDRRTVPGQMRKRCSCDSKMFDDAVQAELGDRKKRKMADAASLARNTRKGKEDEPEDVHPHTEPVERLLGILAEKGERGDFVYTHGPPARGERGQSKVYQCVYTTTPMCIHNDSMCIHIEILSIPSTEYTQRLNVYTQWLNVYTQWLNVYTH